MKELVENALDAAATRIDVAIQNGGKTEIRVADDGVGMGREDALLALDRHATSKITDAEDLHVVRSFGFRGEAIPSIASVSRLTIETAEPSGVGTRVRVAGGRIAGAEDCARQRGTTVVARSLFYNVAARQKFLRSAAAESRAVVEVTTTLALANLSAAFRLESNGRTLLDLPPAGDLGARIAAIWGDETAGRLLPVDGEHAGVRVGGLIERPDRAGTGPRRVYLFVQGRPFRDRFIVAAAERAYRTTVPQPVRPSLFLYLELAAGAVDVNVHPSKAEVRVRDRIGVEAAVEAAVRGALARLESAATLDRRPTIPQLATRPAPVPSASIPEDQFALFVPGPRVSIHDEKSAGLESVELPEAPRPVLWQVHDTYIIAETRSGVLIIDQHSAHERILFEEMMGRFAGKGRVSQRLLFPLTLRLSPAEFAVVEDLLPLFEQAGFEIAAFGGRTVLVHATPAPHPYFNAERCLREMIAELSTGSDLTRAAGNQQERIAMTFACKAAIKAGQKLSPQEMHVLFDALFGTELPSHDVHGRPTIVRLSLDELQRRFGRHG